jgi:hypothetical protein
VKIIIRLFSKRDEGTRENNHQTLFEVPQWRGQCTSKTSGQMSSRAPLQSHIEDVLMDIFFSLPFPAGNGKRPQERYEKR